MKRQVVGDDLLGVGDAAHLLGQPRHRVAYLLDAGKVNPAAVVGGRRLLLRSQLPEIAVLLRATAKRAGGQKGREG